MKDILKRIKGIFESSMDPDTKNMVDTNRSVNYYRPDWVEPEDMEEDYKKWKDYMASMNKYKDTLNAFPSEYEFRNMTDPYLAIRDNAGAATKRSDSAIEFNSSYKAPNQRTLKHELFHSKGDPTYWEDWSRSTAKNFQSMPEWIKGISRKAKPYADMGFLEGNQLARQFREGGSTKVNPYDAADELGAYMFEGDWHKKKKPDWMSNRDYQIMLNFINQRMGLFE